MPYPESKYSLLKEDEPRSSGSEYEPEAVRPRTSFQRVSRRGLWPWLAHGMLLTSSITFFALGTFQYHRATESSIEPGWTREYAPAVRSVGQRHGWQLLGEFDQPSPWRGNPNPDIDEAWESVTHAGVFPITAEEVERMGKLTNSTVILPDESGGGYMASMEATHQLHCLDMLRKFSYRDYYADKAAPFSDPKKLRTHMDHCIEMLRQKIMCDGDLHLITYNWVAHVDYPWPDFSTSRQCRNWGNILDWVLERTAHTKEEHGLIRRPPGQAVKDVNPVEYVHIDF